MCVCVCVCVWQGRRRTRRRQRTSRHSSRRRTKVRRRRSIVIRRAPLTPPTFSSSLTPSLTSLSPTTCAAAVSTDPAPARTHAHTYTNKQTDRRTDTWRHCRVLRTGGRDMRVCLSARDVTCYIMSSSFLDDDLTTPTTCHR